MKRTVVVLALFASLLSADKVISLDVTGMMCPACVSNVKTSLSGVSGVKNAEVFLKSGKAKVTVADKTTPNELCDAVTQAGYGCKVAK